MAELELDDGDCNQREPEISKVPVGELGLAAQLSLLDVVVTRRPPPAGVPAFKDRR